MESQEQQMARFLAASKLMLNGRAELEEALAVLESEPGPRPEAGLAARLRLVLAVLSVAEGAATELLVGVMAAGVVEEAEQVKKGED